MILMAEAHTTWQYRQPLRISAAFCLFAVVLAVVQRSDSAMMLNNAAPKRFSSTEEEISNKTATALKSALSSTDPLIRPDVDGPPVIISMNFYISSFSSINELTMDYKMNIYLREYWVDPRMRYKPFPGQRIPMVLPSRASSSIWLPDIYFPNEKEASFHSVTVPNQAIRIYPNGSVEYIVRVTLTLACPMDLSSFPMDKQVCMIKLESFSYETTDIVLRWQEDPIERDDDLELPQFNLGDIRTCNCSKSYKTGKFPCLKATFSLIRSYGFFLLQTYIPSILIVILSWVSFWINMDAVPARISLGVTTVLTMATQLSGSKESIPKVSYPKAIDIWMAMCMMFVFAALLEYAFINALSRQNSEYEEGNEKFKSRAEDRKQVAANSAVASERDVVHTFSLRRRVQDPRSNRKLASTIDMSSRFVFPGIFILFNVVYWSMYIHK